MNEQGFKMEQLGKKTYQFLVMAVAAGSLSMGQDAEGQTGKRREDIREEQERSERQTQDPRGQEIGDIKKRKEVGVKSFSRNFDVPGDEGATYFWIYADEAGTEHFLLPVHESDAAQEKEYQDFCNHLSDRVAGAHEVVPLSRTTVTIMVEGKPQDIEVYLMAYRGQKTRGTQPQAKPFPFPWKRPTQK